MTAAFAAKIVFFVLGIYAFAAHMAPGSACPIDPRAKRWPYTVHVAIQNESELTDVFYKWAFRVSPGEYDRITWTDDSFAVLAKWHFPHLRYDLYTDWEDKKWLGQRMVVHRYGGVFIEKFEPFPLRLDTSRLRFVPGWYLSGRANDSAWDTDLVIPICSIYHS